MTTTYDVYDGATLVASGLVLPSYRRTNVPNGVLRSFQVSAVNAAGEGAKSVAATATPTATPVGAGPRTAPSTPAGITCPLDGSGATGISTQLQNWVNAQPDGSTLIFPSGSLYTQEAFGLDLGNRQNLTLWGYGSTLHNVGGSNGENSNIYTGWGAGGARNIKVLGFNLKGCNPNGGTQSAYTVGRESAMGLGLWKNALNWEVADNTITDQWQGGLYVHDFGGSYGYTQDLNFHHNEVARTGLGTINIANGIRLTIADNLLTDCGGSGFDIEDASAGESIHSVYFLRNVINRWQWSYGTPHAFSFDGPGDLQDLRIQGNTLLGGSKGTIAPSYSDGVFSIWGPQGHGTVLVDSNDASAISGALPSGSWGMRFNAVSGLTVTNNLFPGVAELAHKVSCTSVTQTGNTPA